MNISKKQIAYGSTAALAVALLVGGGVYTAQAASTQGTQVSSLVQKIAQKFGVPQADVQAVFDANKQEHMQHMQAQAEQRLTDLVTAGKITQAQKDLIVVKQKELQANHQANFEVMKGKTQAERKTAMDAQRTELEAWAKTNGIDLRYLMPFGGMGGRGLRGQGPSGSASGHRGGMGRGSGMMGTSNTQTAPSTSTATPVQ